VALSIAAGCRRKVSQQALQLRFFDGEARIMSESMDHHDSEIMDDDGSIDRDDA
jgi:hypothetical protein